MVYPAVLHPETSPGWMENGWESVRLAALPVSCSKVTFYVAQVVVMLLSPLWVWITMNQVNRAGGCLLQSKNRVCSGEGARLPCVCSY